MMPTKETIKQLGSMVRRKRGAMSMRDAAKAAGIGHSTLHRVENGGTPDLKTFALLCEWIPADPAKLLGIRNVEYLR